MSPALLLQLQLLLPLLQKELPLLLQLSNEKRPLLGRHLLQLHVRLRVQLDHLSLLLIGRPLHPRNLLILLRDSARMPHAHLLRLLLGLLLLPQMLSDGPRLTGLIREIRLIHTLHELNTLLLLRLLLTDQHLRMRQHLLRLLVSQDGLVTQLLIQRLLLIVLLHKLLLLLLLLPLKDLSVLVEALLRLLDETLTELLRPRNAHKLLLILHADIRYALIDDGLLLELILTDQLLLLILLIQHLLLLILIQQLLLLLILIQHLRLLALTDQQLLLY